MSYLLAGQTLATLINLHLIAPPPAVLASYTILVYSTKEFGAPITAVSTKALPVDSCFPSKLIANKKVSGYSHSPAIKVNRSPILAEIANSSGLLSATIAVCDLAGKCSSYKGDIPPQSAASLIKIPIAIALLHKLSTENISLDKTIYVNPKNFTEEDYSHIKVGEYRTFRYLLTETIANSSNIATNQIIDYLGWNYINRVLAKLGYRTTRVGYKLTGKFTNPIANRGFASNRITSNELTAMMVQIYNCDRPEYNVLTHILKLQVDRVLGFEALQTSAGHWLGEKTGENTKVRGSTLAVEINGKIYIITLTEDNGKSAPQIRRCIAQIVDYIAKNGGI